MQQLQSSFILSFEARPHRRGCFSNCLQASKRHSISSRSNYNVIPHKFSHLALIIADKSDHQTIHRTFHFYSKIVQQSPAAPCVAIRHLRIDRSRDICTSHRADVNIGPILHLSSFDQELVRRCSLIWQIAGLPIAIEDSDPGGIRIVFLDDYEVLIPKTGQVWIVLIVYPLFHIRVVLSQCSSRYRKLYTSSLEGNLIGGVQLPGQGGIEGGKLACALPSVRNGFLCNLPSIQFVDGGSCICMSGQKDGHAKFVFLLHIRNLINNYNKKI